MPPDAKTARWKIWLGYSAFALFSLIVGLYLTFPYDAVQETVKTLADQNGLYVKMSGLGPGLFGITADNVQISQKALPTDTKPPEPLVIKKVAVRPSLFPLGAHFSANAFGGSVSGAVGGLSEIAFDLSADDLDLSQGNLKGFSGADLSGKVDADVMLRIPKSQIGGKGPSEPDLGAANGTLSLSLKNVQVNGGSLMGGNIDLPKVPLGDLVGKVKFDKGVGTIDELSGKADGFELKVSGTLKLAKRLVYSEPNLEIRIKAEPAWLDHLGPYKFGVSILQGDPKDPTWRLGRLTGYLGQPRFP
jgi:type II secretion system protein N